MLGARLFCRPGLSDQSWVIPGWTDGVLVVDSRCAREPIDGKATTMMRSRRHGRLYSSAVGSSAFGVGSATNRSEAVAPAAVEVHPGAHLAVSLSDLADYLGGHLPAEQYRARVAARADRPSCDPS